MLVLSSRNVANKEIKTVCYIFKIFSAAQKKNDLINLLQQTILNYICKYLQSIINSKLFAHFVFDNINQLVPRSSLGHLSKWHGVKLEFGFMF